MALFAAGCSDSVTGLSDLETGLSVPTALQLQPGRLELEVGASAEIRVSMTDQNGSSLPIPTEYEIQWSSSSEDVASVADGMVVAKAPGQILIAAQADDLPVARYSSPMRPHLAVTAVANSPEIRRHRIQRPAPSSAR